MDDDQHVLAGLRTTLRKRFEVETALSASSALRLIRERAPFEVIVSDEQMPGGTGTELLAQARRLVPQSARVLLTGHATVDSATRAVNEGGIFRLLLKPCPPDILIPALNEAVQHGRAARAVESEAQAKVDAVTAQLVEAERLSSVATIAAAVGHEMNSLATVFSVALHGILEDAASGTTLDPDHTSSMRYVRSHMAAHAQNLLGLAQPSDESTLKTDLVGIAVGTVELMRTTGLLRSAEVHVDVPEEEAFVSVRRAQLEQVLLNLLRNAMEAVRGMRERTPEVRLTVSSRPDAGQVRCSVQDNGCGIDEEALSRIYDPDFSTKPQGHGTGLGLFATRVIVEAAGGSIEVQSTAGVGTTFTLVFPMETQSVAAEG